ncbi:MAG: hypothetical protein QXS68_06530 [Candidatus Methanomethylicaceae archaeon]
MPKNQGRIRSNPPATPKPQGPILPTHVIPAQSGLMPSTYMPPLPEPVVPGIIPIDAGTWEGFQGIAPPSLSSYAEAEAQKLVQKIMNSAMDPPSSPLDIEDFEVHLPIPSLDTQIGSEKDNYFDPVLESREWMNFLTNLGLIPSPPGLLPPPSLVTPELLPPPSLVTPAQLPPVPVSDRSLGGAAAGVAGAAPVVAAGMPMPLTPQQQQAAHVAGMVGLGAAPGAAGPVGVASNAVANPGNLPPPAPPPSFWDRAYDFASTYGIPIGVGALGGAGLGWLYDYLVNDENERSPWTSMALGALLGGGAGAGGRYVWPMLAEMFRSQNPPAAEADKPAEKSEPQKSDKA